MLKRSEIWNKIASLVKGQGLEVFDIEMPEAKSATLRVYLITKDSDSNVDLDRCAEISKAIRKDSELTSLDPYGLEVSSAGINRKLSRPEHFTGAIGERLKLVFKFGEHSGKAVFGELKSFAEDAGIVLDEKTNAEINFALNEIKAANVDFVF